MQDLERVIRKLKLMRIENEKTNVLKDPEVRPLIIKSIHEFFKLHFKSEKKLYDERQKVHREINRRLGQDEKLLVINKLAVSIAYKRNLARMGKK